MPDSQLPSGLSHVDAAGRARMVDVGAKAVTRRRALATARVEMSPGTLAIALAGSGPKGPVLETARLAGIAGAKRTAELIPLCHLLPLDSVALRIEPGTSQPGGADGRTGRADPERAALVITAEATATARTGVEMEALTACSIAALTLIDMLKAVERTLVVTDLRLLSKSGGASGDWVAPC